MATTITPLYCNRADVLDRLYVDEDGATPVPNNDRRDRVIDDIIKHASRRFDRECERPPGGFAPLYQRRLMSGRGAQVLETPEFAMLTKIEVNTSSTIESNAEQFWQDVTGELASGRISIRPIEPIWPKTEIFRLVTFVVDPYRSGNVRATGIWGCVQPDLDVAPPAVAQNDPWFGITDEQVITSLQPVDPATQQAAGWWVTPDDIRLAIVGWVVYIFKQGQAGYGDTGGQASGPPISYPRKIPSGVQDVIDTYLGGKPHLAMVGTEGTDFADVATYPGGYDPQIGPSRWSGWQVSNP